MASILADHPHAIDAAMHRVRHPMSPRSNVVERDPDLIEAISEAADIREARDRAHSERVVPDRMSGYLTGGSFVAALGLWLVLAPPQFIPLGMLAACIAAHVAAASIEFEIGPGTALPTTPVLFVSLFLLPPQIVPLVPLAGLVIAAYVARLRDPDRRERLSVLAGSSWHAMGPAAVFAVAGVHGFTLATIGVCAAALVAQFGCDAAASWVRNCYGLELPTGKLVEALRFTFLADLTLAPVGVAAAFAAPGSAGALVFLAGPILLLAMLQRDREHQIDRAVVLSEAFTQSADRARRDVLTGLRNRLAWEEALAHHADKPAPVGVVLADVDGLKATNDTLGHDAGDRLLVAVAAAISDATPNEGGAIAARLGGDEFGIMLPGALASRTASVADALRRVLSTAYGSPGAPPVGASVGYGLARSGAMLDSATQEADRGVYFDKSRKDVGRR
jgi:diguanylate cyclase (GGDEF)-like protein